MEATKISRRNLNALENGEVGLLPHPVYLKGYVRNYAHLVGLEADTLVAVVEQQSDGDSGYVPQTASVVPSPPAAEPSVSPEPAAPVAMAEPEPASAEAVPVPRYSQEPVAPELVAQEPVVQEPVAAPADDSAAGPDATTPPIVPEPLGSTTSSGFESQIRTPGQAAFIPGGKPRRRIWPLIALLVAAVLAALAYVQFRRIQGEMEAPASAPAVNATAPAVNATAAANAAEELNATLPEANGTESAAPASEPAPAPASAPAPAPQTTPSAKPAAASAVPAPGQNASQSVSGASVEVSRKGTPAAPAASTAEVRTPGMQQLVITAKPGEVCWVEVSEGAQRKRFTVKNGESRRFEFSSKAKVRLGNAGGVSFQLNGAPYPYQGDRGSTANLEIGAR